MSTITLTVTQHAVLAHAIHHSDGKLDWFPDNVKGDAGKSVGTEAITKPTPPPPPA